jgi:hypothetical protein
LYDATAAPPRDNRRGKSREQRGQAMAVRIADSVGLGGRNHRSDTWAVQTLLIKVRKSRGEPAIGLDGAVGPETIGAIKKFQKEQFGWPTPDGRIDPSGMTLKHLNLLTDSSGPAQVLLEPVIEKRVDRWAVRIGADGQIFVQPGDWLSKYSAAVDGNFYTIWPYMRLNQDGQFIAIANPNLIHVGESLYHIPTFLNFRKRNDLPTEQVPQPGPISEDEKKKLTKEFLSHEYGLKGNNLEPLADALQAVEYADAALTVAEVAGLVAEGTVLAGVATGVSLAAAIPGSVFGGIIMLLNELETAEKLAGMRAVAYSTVAWAFGDDAGRTDFPGYSRQLEINQRAAAGNITEAGILRCKKAWTESTIKAKQELERSALGRYGSGRREKSRKVLIDAARRRLMLAGQNDRKALCTFIMQTFDGKLRGNELEVWQANYNAFLYNE